MKVAALWRYPVKSLQGERVDAVAVTPQGVVGDRHFGILDPASGTILSAKRDGRLLAARAMLAGTELTISLPTGETALGLGAGVDAALSNWLGRAVHLIEATPGGRGTYEIPVDFEDDDSPLVTFDGPPGSFVDGNPVHLLTTASLRAMEGIGPGLQWDARRFRPNVVIDAGGEGFVEDAWVGGSVTVGDVVLDVYEACTRCVMTTRAQPGGLDRQLDVLRTINRDRARTFGVYARPQGDGDLRVGDEARA